MQQDKDGEGVRRVFHVAGWISTPCHVNLRIFDGASWARSSITSFLVTSSHLPSLRPCPVFSPALSSTTAPFPIPNYLDIFEHNYLLPNHLQLLKRRTLLFERRLTA